MSYFPSDIPYMTDEELEEHGINAKRERNEMSYISEKIDKIHANTIEIKSAMGNTIIMLDNIKSALKADVQSKAKDAYQRGLDDAWEAARKIFGYKMDGGISIEELDKVFGYAEDTSFCTADIIRHNTAAEAIAKLKAYEEKQKSDDEIKVRDEVIVYGCRGVVTYVHNNLYTVMMHDGSCGNWGRNELKKTGKQHDIDKILEELKE